MMADSSNASYKSETGKHAVNSICGGSTSTRKSQRPSNISFECHDSFFFEALSKKLEQDTQNEKENTRHRTAEENIVGKYYECASASLGGHGLSSVPNSELTLDSILEDKEVSIVQKFEARVVDREVWAGSRLFRTRLQDAFSSSSIASKVARSASGTVLNSGQPTHLNNLSGSVGQNATFSSAFSLKNTHSKALTKNTKATAAGHALLMAHSLQSRSNRSTKSMARSPAVAPGWATSAKVKPTSLTSSTVSSFSQSLIGDELSSAKFLELLNESAHDVLAKDTCFTGNVAPSTSSTTPTLTH